MSYIVGDSPPEIFAPSRPVVVTIGLRPGFGLAVKVSCWVALLVALVSPAAAGRFVDRAIAVLTRAFVRID